MGGGCWGFDRGVVVLWASRIRWRKTDGSGLGDISIPTSLEASISFFSSSHMHIPCEQQACQRLSSWGGEHEDGGACKMLLFFGAMVLRITILENSPVVPFHDANDLKANFVWVNPNQDVEGGKTFRVDFEFLQTNTSITKDAVPSQGKVGIPLLFSCSCLPANQSP